MSEPEPIDEQKPEPMSGHDSLDELLAEKPASQKSDIEEKESQVEEEAKVPAVEPESGDQTSHLFAVRTTGGQEKIVMRLLETKMKMGQIDVQSVLLLDDLKGYVVVEAQDPPSMFNAIQGIRHIRGQLRGELQYSEIDKYLIKKSTVTELSVDNIVEIIGGPFKGMKATITRVIKKKKKLRLSC